MNLSTVIQYRLSRIQPHTISPFIKRLKEIFEFMDQKYQEAAAYYGFDCKGCEDNCCLTRFHHYTLVEYFYIKEGFFCLGTRKQSEMKQRALMVCGKIDEADEKRTSVQQMCPVNVEGFCELYPYRPMICRLHGIPHELERPGDGIMSSPGCGTFALKCREKKRFKFDRTPFYMQMAALENQVRQATGTTQKIKLTVGEMIVTFGDG